jgi:Mce-associated membrane protein
VPPTDGTETTVDATPGRADTNSETGELIEGHRDEGSVRSVPGDDMDSGAAQRSRVHGPWWRRAALASALVLLAAAAGYSTWGAHRAKQIENARDEALSAARTRVPVLLSYQSSRLEADLSVAAEQTTGSFREDYREVLSSVVAPTAEDRGISTRAEVTAAGIVSAEDDSVTVLVFLTQTTTARGQRPTVSGSRVEVLMEPDGAAWKIAGLQPK